MILDDFNAMNFKFCYCVAFLHVFSAICSDVLSCELQTKIIKQRDWQQQHRLSTVSVLVGSTEGFDSRCIFEFRRADRTALISDVQNHAPAYLTCHN